MNSGLRPTGPALVVLSLLFAAGPAAGAVVERIAVRVNDRIVTSSELKTREDDAMKDLLRSRTSLRGEELRTEAKLLRKKIVDETVKELLMLERADELGLKVETAEIDEMVSRMKKTNGIESDEDFAKALAAAGLDEEEVRSSYERNVLIQKVVSREIQSQLDLTDEALRALYATEKEKWRKPDQVHLSEILVLAGEDPTERSVARARIDAARRRIVAGEDFRAVAKELSEGGTKEKGGDLGIITKGDLSSEIDAVVFMLGGGALSEPVETKFGYHLLRVDEKFPVTFLPFEEVKEQVRESYQQKEYEKRLSEYIEKLRKKYFVKVEVEGAGS